MSENNTNIPKIRFPGFIDAWKQHKALDIFESTADKNHPDLPVLSATQEFGMIKRDDIGINIFHDKKNEMTYKRVLPGQFVIHLRSFQGGFAHSAIEGITSPAYTVFGFKELDKHCDYFWKYIFNSDVFIKRLEAVTYGIRDGRSISYNEFLTMPFVYPDYKEQRKIADFFTRIDKLITLHHLKLNHLQDEKNSLLQKMFPKNGADVPEIRFPGFTHAWEQRKLGEVAEQTYGGGTPKTSVKEYWDGSIPWIKSSDLTDGKVSGVIPNKSITKEGLNNSATKLVPKDSIAIITRVGVGKLAYMPFQYTTSQDFLSLSKLKTNPWFTVYASYKKLQSELNSVQGTSIKGITKEELLAKSISIPCDEEQAKIGEFFKQLDHLITLHQCKLNHLQEQKKSLLQQMFV